MNSEFKTIRELEKEIKALREIEGIYICRVCGKKKEKKCLNPLYCSRECNEVATRLSAFDNTIRGKTLRLKEAELKQTKQIYQIILESENISNEELLFKIGGKK